MTSMLRSLAASLVLSLVAPIAIAQTSFAAARGATIEIGDSKGKFDFLRVDSKRNRLLAAHEKDGTADIFDLKAATLIKRIKVGDAVDTAMDPQSKNYYVSVQEAQRVAVIDAETLKEIGSIKTPGPTDAILYDSANHLVYVTFDGGDAVWAIDPVAAKVVATIAIPGVPEFMVFDEKTNRIYLNIKTKNAVAVIDPASNKVVAQWMTAPATEPHGLALDPTTHRIFVAGGNGKLVAIDTSSGSVTDSIEIVGMVDQIAIDLVGGLVYSAGPGKMSVTSALGGKLKALGEIVTASSAKNVAVDPATRAVWTTYTNGKSSFAQSWQPPKPL
jgi:DNA-binding beta-propeller fold protein YncE